MFEGEGTNVVCFYYMSLGMILVLVVLLGYLSNWLNWRFLNYRLTHYLYYIGAFVHESSHALACVLTGAKIQEFTVFSPQPHVIYRPSKIHFVGNLLISSAPVFGGLLFLYLLNHFAFNGYFAIVPPEATFEGILWSPFSLLSELRIFHVESLVMLLLLINVGAMIGPSLQDMKNMWFMLLLLFFVRISTLTQFGLVALSLILANIVLQGMLITLIGLARLLIARMRS